MPGPIQVIPPGLMGLLQLKTAGQMPSTLADVVAPVIELRDWYLTARRVDQFALYPKPAPTVAITNAQIGTFVINQAGGAQAVVPQNQTWYVEQLCIACDPTGAETATDTVRYAPAIANANGDAVILLGPDLADTTLAARTRTLLARADRGYWMFPGDKFCVRVYDNLTTNGWTFTLFFRATPCPI